MLSAGLLRRSAGLPPAKPSELNLDLKLSFQRDAPARLFWGVLQLLTSMGQTALAGGSSSTRTSPALYSDLSCPEGLEELLSAPPPDLGVQRRHGWNPKDCSENIEVKEGGLCFERRPVAQSTDGARGKRGYSRGLHAWEISWPPEQRGTHAVVGVATAFAPLQADHYAALLGSNSESWGWDIGRGKLYHQSKKPEAPQYPAGSQGEQLEVPERLMVVLDMEEGTLGYAVGGTYLGPAFRGLKGRTLYPAVSAVWVQCQVRIHYLGERREPHSLLHLSRLCVRHALGDTWLGQVSSLPLPPTMKQYLLYQ
ncbi:SPRY domain-containing SOCS box protein 2 isoform X2 [Castor canadensis]|uniref:SPRY domain-containing SOCS box protein 2 n=2 Tax=Castor canadensis TaxID=51338 RepID=A0A8B7U3C2_CASCN|nr:SPRY domain-containing SOCS box protein 2 isoform X2 [Castor canadensis]